MNKATPKLDLSVSVVSQLSRQAARQAAGLVAAVGHSDQPADGQKVSAERQMLQFKGWAFSGWEPPHDPTSIPGLLPGL